MYGLSSAFDVPINITHIIIQANFSDEMSHVMRKPDFCICENKDADQLRGSNHAAGQHLCFRYIDCRIPLLPIS